MEKTSPMDCRPSVQELFYSNGVAGVTCEVEDGVASAQMTPCFCESG